eukprot:3294413-Prymnesium_polylepis.2
MARRDGEEAADTRTARAHTRPKCGESLARLLSRLPPTAHSPAPTQYVPGAVSHFDCCQPFRFLPLCCCCCCDDDDDCGAAGSSPGVGSAASGGGNRRCAARSRAARGLSTTACCAAAGWHPKSTSKLATSCGERSSRHASAPLLTSRPRAARRCLGSSSSTSACTLLTRWRRESPSLSAAE